MEEKNHFVHGVAYGKLYLAGEYAILEDYASALITSVPKKITVFVENSDKTTIFDTINKTKVGLLEENSNISCYRSNMVKCVPLDKEGKIRYPDNLEIENCLDNLVYELSIVKPKVVILLGRLVEKHLKKKIIEQGYNTITIYHPSYIHVYRKKEIEKYVEESSKNILKYV